MLKKIVRHGVAGIFGKAREDKGTALYRINGSSPRQYGRASNTNFLGIDFGWFIGGNIAGFVASLMGYQNLYLIFILPVLLAIIFYMLMQETNTVLEQASRNNL